MAAEPLLSMSDVSFRYPDAGPGDLALRPTTLEVSAGEIIRVSGRNGSGKSTLLKVAAGALEPSSGIRRLSAQAKPVYLDQNASAFTGAALTVREQLLVGLGAGIGALHTGQRDKALMDAVANMSTYCVGLEKRLDDFVGGLSGGQRQIVALISALISGSRLLMLDEFTAAMDMLSLSSSVSLVRAVVSRDGVAVLYVDYRVTDLGPGREVQLEN